MSTHRQSSYQTLLTRYRAIPGHLGVQSNIDSRRHRQFFHYPLPSYAASNTARSSFFIFIIAFITRSFRSAS